MNVPHISVVSPVYGSSESLDELCKRLHASLGLITENYEIFLVNDASPDNSWEIIKDLARQDPRVKGINLSRNFGQHHAITAGLDFAMGDWVVVMDCDLQYRPEEITKLYENAQLGYDIVFGLRAERKDPWLKRQFSKVFYRIFSYFSGTKIDNRISNFGIFAQKVIRSVRRFKEHNRSLGLFVIWVGFRRTEIEIDHAARLHGYSSYTFHRLVKLALDSIVAHSDKLLLLTVKSGFLVSVLSLLFAVWIVLRYLFFSTPIIGWTSLIVSIYLTAGLVIGTIGIVGLYVGKIFDEVKRRPLYIIDSLTFEEIHNDE